MLINKMHNNKKQIDSSHVNSMWLHVTFIMRKLIESTYPSMFVGFFRGIFFIYVWLVCFSCKNPQNPTHQNSLTEEITTQPKVTWLIFTTCDFPPECNLLSNFIVCSLSLGNQESYKCVQKHSYLLYQKNDSLLVENTSVWGRGLSQVNNSEDQ